MVTLGPLVIFLALSALALLLLLLVVVGIAVFLYYLATRAGADPVGELAVVPRAGCDVSAALDALAAVPNLPALVTLDGTTRGGMVAGQSIEVPGVLILTSDLTLVATGNIRIDGVIDLPRHTPANPARPIRLTVVSRDGEVRLGPAGTINRQFLIFAGAMPGIGPTGGAVSGPDVQETGANPAAAGQPGESGALITLHGKVVVVEGVINGNDGGPAGVAEARASTFLRVGTARASGGQGGYGGSIVLCAEEEIIVGSDALMRAGEGGPGGEALSQSDRGGLSISRGGPGGPGGDVVFQGTGPREVLLTLRPPPIGVPFFFPQASGGSGGQGGNGSASARRTPSGTGGSAQGFGGTGGAGGTTRFINCVVRPPVTSRLDAGAGGVGGRALALGGPGGEGVRQGGRGGLGEAIGGTGGAGGIQPVFVLRGGGSGSGTAGRAGSGGDATAQGGPGGDATAVIRRGGFSGVSAAEGGKNGSGVAPVPPRTGAGPGAPSGGVGGRVSRVSNPGAP